MARRLAALALLLAACGDRAPGETAAVARGPLPATQPQQEGVALSGGVTTRGVGGACVPCHADVEARYRDASGMHASLTLPSGAGSIEAGLVGTSVTDPLTGATARFDLRDGRYVQRLVYVDPAGAERGSFELPVDLVVGSGRTGRAYFAVRDARLFELPLVWDARARALAFSPRARAAESLAARIDRRCLECHTGDASGADPGRWSHTFAGDVSLGVTCRRCHGDAPEHGRTKAPADVVHPSRLTLERQDELCSQCHLAGVSTPLHPGKGLARDYRPGTPLGGVLGIFRGVPPQDEPSVAAGTARYAERLALSRCATETAKAGAAALVCTTCHDPHPAGEREGDAACSTCHECKTPPAARAGRRCAACHMAAPPRRDDVHPRSTDHFIRRAPPQEEPAESAALAEMAEQNRPIENLLDPTSRLPGSKALAATAYLDGSIVARSAFGEPAPGYAVRAREHLDALPEDDRDAAFLRGLERFEAGDTRAGETSFRRFVERFGAEPDAARYLTWAAYDQLRWKDASEAATALLAEDPYDELAARIRTAAAIALAKPGDAVATLTALRARLGPSAERARQMLDAASRARDAAHAEEAAYDLLLFRPRDADALSAAAHALAFDVKDADRARVLFREALRLVPDALPALVGLALVEHAAGDTDAARDLAARANALKPGIPELEPILAR